MNSFATLTMGLFESWIYPDIPPKFSELFNDDEKKLVVVGVIGKSAFADCNKMAGLDVLDTHPSHLNDDCKEGQVRFYYNKAEPILFLHFETTYDEYCMRDLMYKEMENNEPGHYLNFNKLVRSRFAKMFLFATQVCHIIVYVELSVTFDSSLMSILKSLKYVRDKYVLKLSQKLLKNTNSSLNCSKTANRVCPPRCLFFFENYPDGYDKTEEAVTELEFEIENNIYKLFRNEQIIPNRGLPLVSLPANKRFVYYNTDDKIREDPLVKSLTDLQLTFEKSNSKDDTNSSLEELRPFGGFGKSLALNSEMRLDVEEKKTNFMTFLISHIEEALQFGEDGNAAKFMGKSDFLIPSVKTWYESFNLFHKYLVECPDDLDCELTGTTYKNYVENFDKLMDIDGTFFTKCCDIGYKKACNLYSDPVLSHYGKSYQKALIDDPLAVFSTYARGPNIAVHEQKLRDNYEQYWLSGRGQSESGSFRGNTCILPKSSTKDSISDLNELTLASTCTCGRVQAWRDDPYSMRQENYEFHQILPDSCLFCEKTKRNGNHALKTTINDGK